MSRRGDHPSMRFPHRRSDGTIEAVLQGRTPADRDDLAEVSAFVADLRHVFAGEPARPSLSPAIRPIEARTLSRVRFAFAAAVGGATLAFGGFASAGALPDSMQREVARVADRIGLGFVPTPEAHEPTGDDAPAGNGTPGSGNDDPGGASGGDPGSSDSDDPGTHDSVPDNDTDDDSGDGSDHSHPDDADGDDDNSGPSDDDNSGPSDDDDADDPDETDHAEDPTDDPDEADHAEDPADDPDDNSGPSDDHAEDPADDPDDNSGSGSSGSGSSGSGSSGSGSSGDGEPVAA